MDEQRNEDLNPNNDDIEEKVKRMLDPNIPDEPSASEESSSKPVKIQAVSLSTDPDANGTAPSAPELPSEPANSNVPVTKKSKKVIIPISHDEETAAPETKPSSKSKKSKDVIENPEPDVKQITITDDGESPEAVAEKLDEAIADLDDKKEPAGKEPTEKEESAPELTEAEETEDLEPIEPTQAEPEKPLPEKTEVDSPATDKAVEDIVAAEGDELLEVEDAVRDTDEPVKPDKKPRRNFLETLKAWWKKPGFRKGVLVGGILLVVGLGVVPTTRYLMLNSAGVRVSSSLLVLDNSTQQPLKNVHVKIGNVTGTTDEEGKLKLQKVKLGSQQLAIEKTAFAPVHKTIVIGWGSNPLGSFNLTPTGSQYSFTLTDFLSGKPVAKVEASSGEANALSDDKGNLKLTIDKPEEQQFTVTLKADGYREEKISLKPDDQTNHSIKLVPASKQIYVSKRTGKYDIYSVYIDGKEDKLVLAGTGNEQEGIVLVPHPRDNVVAYVSTRGGQHNSEGFALHNLILISLEDNSTANIVTSERVQIVDWSGDYLVYVQIAAGTSANNPKRYRLVSYNYKTGISKELAASNYFNDVIAVSGTVYYAPSSAYQTNKTGFYKIKPDGSGQQTVLDQEVWNIIRTSYDHLALSVQQQWYDYRIGDAAASKLNSAPANQTPRVYINGLESKYTAWIDSRDGKGTLLIYDILEKKDTTLKAQSGLHYPLRWLSNTILTYRIKTDQETADYTVSLEGGEPVKIRDVTNTGGIDKWYYY